ncbi:Uncharacterised protein [Klebsiella pneumoniae]|nr:Uncharacterised protein [Klebsiella pneumoniae]
MATPAGDHPGGLAGPRHDAGGRPDDRRDLQPGADPAGVPLAAQAGADPADPGGRRYHLLHDPVRRADGRRHAAQRHADQPGRGRRPAFAEARRLPGVAWRAAGLAAVAHAGALPAVATRAAEQAAGGARLPGPACRGGAGQLPGAVLAVPQQQGTAPAGHPEQPGRRRHRLRQGPGPGRQPATPADRRRCPARRPVAGPCAQVADRAGGGRERAGTELRPQRLRSRDQPAAEGRGGPDQLLQRALLRYRDRGVGALHVLQPGPRGLQRRSRAHPGRPSRCVAARRPAGPVAGQPVRLQGHLRPRRLPGPEREQGSGPVRRRRVP